MPPTPVTSLHHLFHPDNLGEYVATMRTGLDHLANQTQRTTGPATGLSPERAAQPVVSIDLDRPLHDAGAALEEMSRVYLNDAVWFHEPTYAAHLNCPIVIPALLAELYVSAVNTSLDTFDQSVGGTFIERHLIDWTAGRIGYDERADGIFTSGGTQSNLQALLMARGQALESGASLDQLRVFASVDGHFSVQKAARLLGLHPDAVVPIRTDESRRMDIVMLDHALAAAVEEGDVPMAIVATAGTTDFGAIDRLPQIARIARRHGAWFHVDAAYGGGLLASRRRRELIAGIEHADSVTIDFHKTFFQPVSASAVLVRDAQTMRHATYHADYLNPKSATQPNQVDKSLQTTRRFDALKLWMTLRIMGADQIGEYFDTAIDLAHDMHGALRVDPDFEVAGEPSLSTVVFRYRPAGLLTDAQADELNPRMRAELYASGAAMVAGTVVDGRAWLKLTLLNPMATRADILGIIDRLREIGEDLTLLETPMLAEVG